MKKYLVSIILPFALFLLCAIHEGHTREKVAPATDVAVVLDDSGSMRENDPEFLTSKVVSELLEYLSRDSRVSFVVFSENAELVMPLTAIDDQNIDEKVKKALDKITYASFEAMATITVQKGDTLWDLARKYYGDPFLWTLIMDMNGISDARRDLLVGAVIYIPFKDAKLPDKKPVRKFTVGEHTNIPTAIEKAVHELGQNGRENAEKLAILVTDGIVDTGNSEEVERYRWLKNELPIQSKESGTRIFTVVLTDQADKAFASLMQTLAQKTQGGYYQVLKPEDIQMALNGIDVAISTPSVTSTPNQPETAPKEVTTTGKQKEISTGLLLVVLVGLVIVGIVAFAFIRKGKKGEAKSIEIPKAQLIDIGGVTGKTTYPINKSVVTIGRVKGDDVDICVGKSTVSATHAQIQYRNHGFYLTDLGSTNGTYLNEAAERITDDVRLRSGDIITFDEYQFRFVLPGQSERGNTEMSEGKQAGTQMSQNEPGKLQLENPSQRIDTVISMRREYNSRTDEDMLIPEAYLIDAGGATDEKIHKLDKRVTMVGRVKRDDIDIQIGKNTVSAAHAQIEYRDSDFYLTDLGSRNGTYLNEGKERITSEVCLKNEDIIYFDQYRFRFVLRSQSEKGETQLNPLYERNARQ